MPVDPEAPIILSVFEASPDRGRGLARDMPVRWALEEAGLAYRVRLLPFAAMKQPDHVARQPFGQIPAYEEDGLVLFESGAIVLHIATRHAGLLPDDAHVRARAISWMFAALSTVEPPIVNYAMASLAERDSDWLATCWMQPQSGALPRARSDLMHALSMGPAMASGAVIITAAAAITMRFSMECLLGVPEPILCERGAG